MQKKKFIYSDLSKKQLTYLKEFYIQKKVDSMSSKELKDFVRDIISHQVHDTIDKEEEMEAWREMLDFFGEEFGIIILDIQKKYNEDFKNNNEEKDPQKERQDLINRNNIEKEKEDMWED